MTNEDIIRREDVINLVHDLAQPCDDSLDYDISADEMIDGIKSLPSVQQQPCDDCISRAYIESIVEELENICINGDEHILSLLSDIKNAPSVTPQQKTTGSWVEKQVVDNEEVEIEQWQSARCNKCDKYHTTPYSYYFDNYNYCPNCGAKMGVE